MVVTPDVDRIQWAPVVVVRRAADEPGPPLRTGQRRDRALKAEALEAAHIPWARSESGAPQQPRGVALGKAPAVNRNRGTGQGSHRWTEGQSSSGQGQISL